MNKFTAYAITPVVLAAAIIVSAVMPIACGNPQVKSGGTAAAFCGINDAVRVVGEIETALGQPDATWSQALAAVAKKENLVQDALQCLVQTILGVMTAQQGSAAVTGQETPIVVHAREFLSRKQ